MENVLRRKGTQCRRAEGSGRATLRKGMGQREGNEVEECSTSRGKHVQRPCGLCGWKVEDKGWIMGPHD